MIVKNNESDLQRCLDSLLPIIHMRDDETLERQVELIIIDTGSNDRTVNVAQKYTDKVFIKEFIPWNFSDARNYGIEMAKGAKIIIVDSDEMLTQGSVYHLMDLILTPKYAEYPTIMFNIHNAEHSTIQYSEFLQPRMFNNPQGPLYAGSIHNKPRTDTPFCKAEHVIFKHYGYDFKNNSQLKHEKMHDRTLPMLLEEYEKNPDDLHILTHLVKTYQVNHEPEKVIEYGEIWMRDFAKAEYTDGWFAFLDCFLHLLVAYITKNDIENAERVRRECEKYSKRIAQMYFILGNYYSGKDNENARMLFEMGIEIINTRGGPFEAMLTTNVKMQAPFIYNWLATYYFKTGEYGKAGVYTNEGIQLSNGQVCKRWDIFNEEEAKTMLKTAEIIKTEEAMEHELIEA